MRVISKHAMLLSAYYQTGCIFSQKTSTVRSKKGPKRGKKRLKNGQNETKMEPKGAKREPKESHIRVSTKDK